MHWYGGSIAEAVTISKQKNAIFVVFVEGDNDLSVEMAATIEDTAVVSRLSNQEQFLAVKLKSGSTNYTHFAQIYQFVPVPSLFFIGRNGAPLEVVCAGVQPSDLATRIDRILADHYKDKPVQPSTSGQNIRDQTSNLLHSEAEATAANSAPKEPVHRDATNVQNDKTDESAPPAKIAKTEEPKIPIAEPKIAESKVPEAKIPDAKSSDYEVVCDGDVCVRRPKPDGASTSGHGSSNTGHGGSNTGHGGSNTGHGAAVADTPNPSEIVQPSVSGGSIEEKMERAKELLEARKREKAEKEKELEIQKELERRMTGQGVAEMKKWQADQELKQMQEERKREKQENNLARQRILEQIAQDRAERRARDIPAANHQATAENTPTVITTSGDAPSATRVQFKLPDGSSHTAAFNATDTLATLLRYVADNLQLPSSQFSLWTAFPRREISGEERTLIDLQLVPSAALLVLPRRSDNAGSAPVQASSIIAFITQLLTSLIYEPTLQVYNWVRARLFPPPAVGPSDPVARQPTPVARQPSPLARPSPPTIRRRGNVHRLPGDSADDENNTWNGNSTQQM